MTRTVDLSPPRWLHVVTVFLLVGGTFVTGFAVLLDVILEGFGPVESGYPRSAAVSALLYLAICGVWYVRARGGDGDGDSVWAAIPESQYTGRHAESGGIARKEQEDAIRELQGEEES